MKKYVIIGEYKGIIKAMGKSIDDENIKSFDTITEAKEVMYAISLEFTLERLEGVEFQIYEKIEE